jgi:hypothetical protein
MLAIMGFAFNSFKNSIDKQFENIDKRFVDSQNSIDKQFTYLNEKIDYKFDTLSKEIDTIKTNHIPHLQRYPISSTENE